MTPYLKYDSVSDTESFIMTPYSKYSPLKNIHSWKIFTPEKYSPLKNIHPWTIFTPEKYSPLKNIQYKIFFEGRIRSHNEWLRIRYGWIFDTESSNCAISPLCTGAGLSDNMEQHVNWTNFNFQRFFRTITHHARWSPSDRLCLPGTLHRRPRVFYDLILSIECIPGIRQASPTSPASFAPHLFANSLRPEHTQHTHSLWKRANTNAN